MREGRCNAEGPDGCHCVTAPGGHAHHTCKHQSWPNEQWTGLSIAEAMLPPKERSAIAKAEAERIAKETRNASSPDWTGLDPEIEAAWSKDEWVDEAFGVLQTYCRTHTESFTTPQHIWPLLRAPREMRMMVVAVNRAVKAGLMTEVEAVRLRGTYRTGDGTEFQMNKLVPVYQPCGPRTGSGYLQDFG